MKHKTVFIFTLLGITALFFAAFLIVFMKSQVHVYGNEWILFDYYFKDDILFLTWLDEGWYFDIPTILEQFPDVVETGAGDYLPVARLFTGTKNLMESLFF